LSHHHSAVARIQLSPSDRAGTDPERHVGEPRCGRGGCSVDAREVRSSGFARVGYDESEPVRDVKT
jgi:hypothetical protein